MKRLLRWWFAEYLFDRYAWFRKLRGGHWEEWCLDWPVVSWMWHEVPACYHFSGHVPPLGRGTPRCEEHRR